MSASSNSMPDIHTPHFFSPPEEIIPKHIVSASIVIIGRLGIKAGLERLKQPLRYRHDQNVITLFHIKLALANLNSDVFNGVLRLIELAHMRSTHRVFKEGIVQQFKYLMEQYPNAAEMVVGQLKTEETNRKIQEERNQFVTPRQAYQQKAIDYLNDYFSSKPQAKPS